MYISWKLRPTNIRCPNEVLGGSESCQTTCHEQAPGVFFDTSMICIFIEGSVMSLQGQRQNRSKGGFSRRKAWDTSENMWRTVVLFWFYGRTLQRTSFKWQVFPSKLLPSKPEVKEESKARENSHCCNHELQKPRCEWTVHRWSEKMSRWRRKSRNFLHKKSRLSGEEKPPWLLRMWCFHFLLHMTFGSFDQVFRPNRSTDCNTSGWGKNCFICRGWCYWWSFFLKKWKVGQGVHPVILQDDVQRSLDCTILLQKADLDAKERD